MNRLLATLEDEERARLQSLLEEVDLPVRREVTAPGVLPDCVYFPATGLVSSVAELGDEVVEVATIGSDGVVGVELLVGGTPVPFRRFVQVAGTFYRMPASDFVRVASTGELGRRVLRYALALYVQACQTSACARVHAVDSRLARWLLMVQDRIGTDRLPLTHEFLGQMLGVRRAAVSGVTGRFERAGYIRNRRGVVEVLDRPALEAAACSCYATIRAAHERALAGSD